MSTRRPLVRFDRTTILLASALLLAGGTTACDRSSPDEAEAEAPEKVAQKAGSDESEGDEEGEEEGHDHEEEGHDHEIRLGLKMQDIGHRFAAIWYAGRAGSMEMLDYQIHELEETAHGIADVGVEEHGVDVGSRLKEDVLSRMEKLEKAAKQGDQEAFEKEYRATMGQCNTCHADTEHDFIDVRKPERNPYANVDLTGGSDEK